VRRLCTYCKRPISASSDFQRLLAKQGLIQGPLTNPIYESNGCSECFNSGFLGRIALMEMCLATHRLQDLIAKGAPQSEMRALVVQSGVLTLYQEGLMQVVQGSTTLKEVGPLSYTSEMSE
jgi:type II secretory ATPase GspE/PulE/Tfp pilus assembly ATPase PilB-like protein